MKYLKIVCFSYIFFAITNTLLFTLRSVETVKIAFMVSLSTLCTNICLNYLLIYGHLGFPEMGAAGAATATLTSRILETLIVIVFLAKKDTKIGLKLRDYAVFDKKLFKEFLKTGLPVVIANFSWGIALGLNTAILGRLGQRVISASSIATAIFQIFVVVAYGSANGTQVLIAKMIGEGKTVEEIKPYVKTLQIIYLLIGIGTGLMLRLGTNMILSFYNITEEAYTLAKRFLHILSFTSLGTAYAVAAEVGIAAGGGDTRFTFINDTIFMWGIGIPSATICAFKLHTPPEYVFLCLKSDQILKCITGAIKVNRYKWVKPIDLDQPDLS